MNPEYEKNIRTMLELVKEVDGDIIELGVYKGKNTIIIGEHLTEKQIDHVLKNLNDNGPFGRYKI